MSGGGRLSTALRWGAALVVVLCVALLCLEATARRTVVSTGYYQQILDDQHAYDRLYDEVLVDPESSDLTRDLLDRLPIPSETVLSNLKVVLPPATVRQLTNDQIDAAVRYLRGDTGQLRLSVDLSPVVANLAVLGQDYFGDLVASLQRSDAPDFPTFFRSLHTALDELSRGERISSLPAVPLNAREQATVERLLLAAVPADERDQLRAPVAAALASDDLDTALATVGPYVLTGRIDDSARDLISRAGSTHWDLVPDLEHAHARLGTVRTIRSVTVALLGPLRLVAVLLGLAALAVLWSGTGRSVHRRLTVAGGAVSGGGALGLLLVIITWSRVRQTVPSAPAGWPPSLQSLADDLQHAGAAGLLRTGAFVAAIPLLAGLLVLAGAWLIRLAPRLPRPGTTRHAIGAGAIAAVLVATVVGIGLFPARGAGLRCLGSERMCALRYDQVAFLTTHNAMSNTTDRFIAPLQDPGIISQLDQGARALMIDTYTWERAAEVKEKLSASDLSPELQAKLPSLINMVNPPQPGLWLCHALCRAGATPLVATLRQLRAWLRDNPDQIVTLIIQDDISRQQTAKAFTQAGLGRLLVTPPADPDAPWPTLGSMIRANRRLVVFAEKADGPAPWYRNFYDYAMETPFSARTPADLSCASWRGLVGKRLFLLNHFVTAFGGSRLDAAAVNTRRYILDRVHRCQRVRRHDINFIAVDYATIGDALGAVDAINAERLAAEK